MQQRASFIQVGERYFGTIKTASGEEVIKENGRNIPFTSSVKALSAAQRIIEISQKPPIEAAPKQKDAKPQVVVDWEAARQASFERDRLKVLGVTVVHKRRFRNVGEDRARGS